MSGFLVDSISAQIRRLTPLRYYPLNDAVGSGTAIDLSGNGRNGAVNGGMTFGQAGLIAGETGTSALFNGSTGYVNCPTSGLPTGAAAWSMFCWVKMPSSLPGSFPVAMAYGSTASDLDSAFLLYNGGKFYLASAATLQINGGNVVANGVYLITVTCDGTTTVLYLNNTQLGNKVIAWNMILSFALIGQDTQGHFWSGKAAHPTWLNFALSTDQVAAIWRAGVRGQILGGI